MAATDSVRTHTADGLPDEPPTVVQPRAAAQGRNDATMSVVRRWLETADRSDKASLVQTVNINKKNKSYL